MNKYPRLLMMLASLIIILSFALFALFRFNRELTDRLNFLSMKIETMERCIDKSKDIFSKELFEKLQKCYKK